MDWLHTDGVRHRIDSIPAKQTLRCITVSFRNVPKSDYKKTVTGAETDDRYLGARTPHYPAIAVERSNKYRVLYFQEINSLPVSHSHYAADKFPKNANIQRRC